MTSSPTRQLHKTRCTELVVEVNLLGNCPRRDDGQDVRDQQIHLLTGACLSDGQTNTFASLSVPSPTIDKWRMESVHIVVLSEKCEALSDRVVTTLIGPEVGGKFLWFNWAVLLCNDALLGKDDSLRPLR